MSRPFAIITQHDGKVVSVRTRATRAFAIKDAELVRQPISFKVTVSVHQMHTDGTSTEIWNSRQTEGVAPRV